MKVLSSEAPLLDRGARSVVRLTVYANPLFPNMDTEEWNMVEEANMEDRGQWERGGGVFFF